ncbi:MAG: TRAP transporter small permease [Methylobacteriaceae bacterium]|jgi:TRAP-type C4-dicarboxylate transport system permease small subunit|nr:TRAP transporter small permease [Methylobacteriaceae bacterium]
MKNNTLNSLKKPVDAVLAAVICALMVALVVCVVWQVYSRYVIAKPSTLTDEIARFLLIWLALLGASYVVGQQKHLTVDIFAAGLSGSRKDMVNISINLMILVFCAGVILFGGILLVRNVMSSYQVAPALRIPMGYIYFVLPLSGFIMSCYSLLFIADDILSIKSHKLSE